VIGSADVEVLGFVDGEVAVTGSVTVGVHGMVGAGIKGRRVVVRGSVRGDLVGAEAVLVEEGARVVGDVRAPSVAIAPGALVRGFVQAGEPESTPATRATETSRAAPTPSVAGRAAAKPEAAPSTTAAPRTAPVAHPPQTRAAATTHVRPQATRAAAPAHPPAVAVHPPAPPSSPRRPPPPVVPAFRKVRGQMVKKRER
jgi:cytoskeletal protein CcmA (bactofilin family)